MDDADKAALCFFIGITLFAIAPLIGLIAGIMLMPSTPPLPAP